MDVGKFIDEYDAAKSDNARAEVVKRHVVKHYMPLENKIVAANEIVEKSMRTEDGNFKMNSPLRYVLSMKQVITAYTDLVFDTTNFMIQFNLMEERNLFDQIIAVIGTDYSKYDVVLKMAQNDYITNNRSVISFIERTYDSAMLALDDAAKKYLEAQKQNVAAE